MSIDRAIAAARAIEPLPAEVSPDGREIWDWAGRLSERVHLMAEINELRADVRAPKRCGGCVQWMTRQCPREIHSNQTGRSTGPSMKAAACPRYNEKPCVTELRAERAEKLAALEAKAFAA